MPYDTCIDTTSFHRDMKLGNLFLNKDMEIRVGDLGLSAKLSDQSEQENHLWNPNYIAPEIIAGKSHSFEVDVWSLGVILFTMLFGKFNVTLSACFPIS